MCSYNFSFLCLLFMYTFQGYYFYMKIFGIGSHDFLQFWSAKFAIAIVLLIQSRAFPQLQMLYKYILFFLSKIPNYFKLTTKTAILYKVR